ncbi:MAG: glycosyltransferase family 2 protein [Sphingorhabdus sp.]
MTLSICTLGTGRAAHLHNLVEGLNRQSAPPVELVVGVMQDAPYDLGHARFPVRQILLGGGAMPLAAARNAAAKAAISKRLAFLDIDCIPAPDFIADYADHLADRDGIIMGEVLYLPSGAADDGLDFDHFAKIGEKHSERAGPPDEALGECTDYRCFWSLNFAMHHDRFIALGGFDEGYTGYGGEDTDFGRTAADAGIPLLWCRGARAYHQYHAHYMPPVHHLDSVLANARRFRDKWGYHTMDRWLRAFELMGLIEQRGRDYVRLRDPDEADYALTAQQANQPYASSLSVLRVLEAQAVDAAPVSAAA